MLYFLRNLSKTKVLRYLKVMISKFNFYKKNITPPFPPPELFELSKG